LALGMSARKAAEKHGVTHPTVIKWAKNFPELSEKKDIGDLVEDHLRNELRTLSAIAEHTTDKEWLAKQSSDALAILYGVMSDKAHAKLAALATAQRQQQATQENITN
jgi:hypothetical protein